MQIHWLWLAVGIIPYSIKRQYTKHEQLFCAHALFWHLTIRWQQWQGNGKTLQNQVLCGTLQRLPPRGHTSTQLLSAHVSSDEETHPSSRYS